MFRSPDKQYEFATSFLKVGDYSTAERAFREFVNTNPEHDLAGNAQYWYGETFRIRQLYSDAATAYDRIPLPDEKKEIKKVKKKKQNPEEVEPQIRQSSEFEKKEIINTNEIAALIDKAKEEEAVEKDNTNKLTQSSVKNSFATGLSLSEEDALRAQIFGCWSVPLGLPYDKDLWEGRFYNCRFTR